MRVYLAGASAELERAKRWMERLRAEGFVVPLDWTEPVEEHGTDGAALSEEERRALAVADETAVADSDVLWLLVPHVATKGAWWECGIARHAGVPIIVSGAADDIGAMFFLVLADERFGAPPSRHVPQHLHGLADDHPKMVIHVVQHHATAQEVADARAFEWLRGHRAGAKWDLSKVRGEPID